MADIRHREKGHADAVNTRVLRVKNPSSKLTHVWYLIACHSYLQVFKENPIRNSYIVENQIGTNNTTTNIGRPNTALLHTVISFSTFGIAVGLRLFQDTRYFSPPVCIKYFFYAIKIKIGFQCML